MTQDTVSVDVVAELVARESNVDQSNLIDQLSRPPFPPKRQIRRTNSYATASGCRPFVLGNVGRENFTGNFYIVLRKPLSRFALDPQRAME